MTDQPKPITPAEALALVDDLHALAARYGLLPDVGYELCDATESLAAQVERLRKALDGIAQADYRKWDTELRDPESFVDWARSLAQHALAEAAGR